MARTLPPVAPRTDLRSGFVWIALGAVAVFASWQMDRFEQQGATLHSAPGLWPGIVGLVIALLGGALAWRSVLRARETGWREADIDETQLVPRSQLALAATMFLTYALLLVGHGLPFWLGTGAFVTLFIFAFRRADRLARGSPGSNRADAILALTCGVVTALVVTYTFENLFYVRLP